MAWGGDLGDAKPSEPGGCYMLSPQPVPDGGPAVLFMIEADKFARVDVRSDAVTAPGGGKVGMTRSGIERVYGADKIAAQPQAFAAGHQQLSTAVAPAGIDILHRRGQARPATRIAMQGQRGRIDLPLLRQPATREAFGGGAVGQRQQGVAGRHRH